VSEWIFPCCTNECSFFFSSFSLRDGATGGNSLEPEDFADAMGDTEAWSDYIAL
jgi:hypothetical protein